MENTYLVPAIAAEVSEREQDSFNSRVLRVLGLFNSRMYLVGMYEAVADEGAEEMKKFEQEIPYLMRMLIPRWRRLLYEPRAGALLDSTRGKAR